MTMVVMGHGARDPGRGNTFVPAGTSLKFYSNFDENMFFTNGLAALSDGGFGNPNETVEDDDVANYILEAVEDWQMQRYLTVDRSGADLYFVGERLPANSALCTTPAQCRTAGVHSCAGVLGVAARAGETEVVFLACRGALGGPGQGTQGMGEGGTDTTYKDELDEWVTNFVGLTQSDPDAAARQWDGLPQGTQAILMEYTRVQEWSYRREAKRLLAEEGPETLARFVDSQGRVDERLKTELMGDADIAEAYWVGYGRRIVSEQGDQEFLEWYNLLDEGWQGTVLADPTLKASLDRMGAAGAPSEPTPRELDWADVDWSYVQRVNQSNLKVLEEDESLPFWQSNGGLLLGQGFPLSYYKLFEELNGKQPDGSQPDGQVLMVSKGGVMSRGSIRVTGSYDSSSFEASIAEFSKKECEFA
ncbi:MAG TPA: hypothetical protein VF855_12775 [Acidimicrobiales bacterium]